MSGDPIEAIRVAVARRKPQDVESFLEHRVEHPEDRVHRAGAAAHVAHGPRLAGQLEEVSQQKDVFCHAETNAVLYLGYTQQNEERGWANQMMTDQKQSWKV